MGGVEKIRHQISVQNRVRNSADDVSVVSNQPIVVYINNMAATVLHRKVDSAYHGRMHFWLAKSAPSKHSNVTGM